MADQIGGRRLIGVALIAAGLALTLSGLCTASVVSSPSNYEVEWSGAAIAASVAVALAGAGLIVWGYRMMRRNA